jgi:hypothetical protein
MKYFQYVKVLWHLLDTAKICIETTVLAPVGISQGRDRPDQKDVPFFSTASLVYCRYCVSTLLGSE